MRRAPARQLHGVASTRGVTAGRAAGALGPPLQRFIIASAIIDFSLGRQKAGAIARRRKRLEGFATRAQPGSAGRPVNYQGMCRSPRSGQHRPAATAALPAAAAAAAVRAVLQRLGCRSHFQIDHPVAACDSLAAAPSSFGHAAANQLHKCVHTGRPMVSGGQACTLIAHNVHTGALA